MNYVCFEKFLNKSACILKYSSSMITIFLSKFLKAQNLKNKSWKSFMIDRKISNKYSDDDE